MARSCVRQRIAWPSGGPPNPPADVEAGCLEKGVGITPYGSWTLESKESERGVEPDECYVLGDVADPERCDLAIEVMWTSGGVNKLDVYRRPGVKEVWIWKAGAIEV